MPLALSVRILAGLIPGVCEPQLDLESGAQLPTNVRQGMRQTLGSPAASTFPVLILSNSVV